MRTGDENRVISPLVVLEGIKQLLASHSFFNGLKWWPGTELNRRRQPFQGCALPPELPGHFLSALLVHKTTANLAVHRARSHWAGYREAKQPMRWDRAEPSNYSNPVPFLKIVADDSRRVFSCSRSFSHSFHDERRPLGTPFMIVSAQRLPPNQYGISR